MPLIVYVARTFTLPAAGARITGALRSRRASWIARQPYPVIGRGNLNTHHLTKAREQTWHCAPQKPFTTTEHGSTQAHMPAESFGSRPTN
jgi:hypothetical protein